MLSPIPVACHNFFTGSSNMQIEEERPGDAAVIRDITYAAFKDKIFSTQTEADVIDALRAAGELTISLLAIEEGEVVGHVAFSPVSIDGEKGEWYGLGPVAVRPDRQLKGIGQALIRNGLDRLRSLKAKGCVLAGDPAYYGRFGFANDPELRYGNIPQVYFQCLTFQGQTPKGEVAFHSSFDL